LLANTVFFLYEELIDYIFPRRNSRCGEFVEKKAKMNHASRLKIGYQKRLRRKRDGYCGKEARAERSTGYAMPLVCIRGANLPRHSNCPVDSLV
jgi:hypothetical protein